MRVPPKLSPLLVDEYSGGDDSGSDSDSDSDSNGREAETVASLTQALPVAKLHAGSDPSSPRVQNSPTAGTQGGSELLRRLHDAVRLGDVRGVQAALREGADTNERHTSPTNSRIQSTPLCQAVTREHKPIVRVLLQHQTTDVNAQQSDGRNALFLAVQKGNVEIVQLLVDAGASATSSTAKSQGQTWTCYSIAERMWSKDQTRYTQLLARLDRSGAPCDKEVAKARPNRQQLETGPTQQVERTSTVVGPPTTRTGNLSEP